MGLAVDNPSMGQRERRIAVFVGRLLKELFRLTPTSALLGLTPTYGPAGFVPAVTTVGLVGFWSARGYGRVAALTLAVGVSVTACHVLVDRRRQRQRRLHRDGRRALRERRREAWAVRLGDPRAANRRSAKHDVAASP